jgi:hypothetical protein
MNIKDMVKDNKLDKQLEMAHKESIKTELVDINTKIDAAVYENFGYDPQEAWFDDLVDNRNKLEQLLK